MLRSVHYSHLNSFNRNRNNERTILVVDDNESFLTVTEQVLSDWGFDVLKAPDGKEAVSICKTQTPDGILMDLSMPNLDGYEAFFEMKKINPELKIFLMTAYAHDERIEKLSQEGILFVFEKPFSLRYLKRKLYEHLGRGKPTEKF